ncbi:HupE/UreJ family protein [Rhodoflexus caldus]|uniref:HupE/UreJ family protein n=1 Tax=Rhodoflexus caldus TaxID=2891236 RepID=UPI00202A1376|nr:HupE/UreJ family protein [Rhodoflexus caldus]
MSDFQLYLIEGFRHISDLGAYDHILFITALCAIYQFSEWKKILILVTAFTIGHSVTLALATLRIVSFPTEVIEFLIPITIVITCLFNFFSVTDNRNITKQPMGYRYVTAALFGLIHGLGFSNFLRSMLGKEESIVTPLFAFNVGLEIGQLAIVFAILLLSGVMTNFLKVKQREWNLILSGIVLGISITLIQKTWIF